MKTSISISLEHFIIHMLYIKLNIQQNATGWTLKCGYKSKLIPKHCTDKTVCKHQAQYSEQKQKFVTASVYVNRNISLFKSHISGFQVSIHITFQNSSKWNAQIVLWAQDEFTALWLHRLWNPNCLPTGNSRLSKTQTNVSFGSNVFPWDQLHFHQHITGHCSP